MDYARLNREISYALRHHPEEYGLEPDDAGFVPVDELVRGINARHPERVPLTRDDVKKALENASKLRHELYHDKIRALYGHSFRGRSDLEPGNPPDVLYHGTTPRVIDAIMSEGLRPMTRQLVHMSPDFELAIEAGTHHSYETEPVVVVVDTQAAQRDGIEFYHAAPHVWLCNHVPPQYLRVLDWR